jgi:serine phosphatase RsbU (regulator of sigma subunit)
MNYMLTLADISSDTWSEDLDEQRRVLGRADNAEIRLDHASVSRHHCAFWCENDTCWIQDCESTNGTFVNGIKITKEKIRIGDTIVVGRFELILAEKDQLKATVELPEPNFGVVPFSNQQAEERQLAAIIHQRLTPSRRMSLPGLIVDVIYQPSGILGGDCFESYELENRWILSVFDPMTHGVKAAMNSMLLRAELQRWVTLTAEPGRCLQWINSEMCLLGINDLFVAAAVASWFPRTQTLVYAAAGEHPPLVVREGVALNLGEMAGGMPLGVSMGEHYSEHIVQLRAGDRVYFFTDGLGEVMSDAAETVTTASELAKRLAATAGLPLAEQMRSVTSLSAKRIVDDVLFVGCEVIPG